MRGIRKAEQVKRDPLMGTIFDNLVFMEYVKSHYHRGEPAIKSASTFSMSLLRGLGCFRGIVPSFAREVLIHSGDPHVLSDGTEARHFRGAGLFASVTG